ncbi:hypothetical protein [Pelorhabdus rhamnosifermentans]|uniref:hypothetical protein n=1 Tax=Pelorhabdus rhamnosifermentans TaxID=2772457 RepID=UPI001C061125|nr:hypothetical protein [Pelorhabdus rhamnosifermentans]
MSKKKIIIPPTVPNKKERDWLVIGCTIVGVIIALAGVIFTSVKYFDERPRLQIVQSDAQLYAVSIKKDDNSFLAIFPIKIINPSTSLMTIDHFEVDASKINAKEYAYGIVTKDFVNIKEFRLKHFNPNSSVTYSIYPEKYLVPRFEIGPKKIEEGYIVISGVSSEPVTAISLKAHTQDGVFPFKVNLTSAELIKTE